MITIDVRKQGGAAVMTIPANLLKILDIHVGSKLDLNIENGALIAKPSQRKSKYKRYTIEELFRGATPETMKALNEETAWAREDGEPVGHEIV